MVLVPELIRCKRIDVAGKARTISPVGIRDVLRSELEQAVHAGERAREDSVRLVWNSNGARNAMRKAVACTGKRGDSAFVSLDEFRLCACDNFLSAWIE